jgi:hypothetical protein
MYYENNNENDESFKQKIDSKDKYNILESP